MAALATGRGYDSETRHTRHTRGSPRVHTHTRTRTRTRTRRPALDPAWDPTPDPRPTPATATTRPRGYGVGFGFGHGHGPAGVDPGGTHTRTPAPYTRTPAGVAGVGPMRIAERAGVYTHTRDLILRSGSNRPMARPHSAPPAGGYHSGGSGSEGGAGGGGYEAGLPHVPAGSWHGRSPYSKMQPLSGLLRRFTAGPGASLAQFTRYVHTSTAYTHVNQGWQICWVAKKDGTKIGKYGEIR